MRKFASDAGKNRSGFGPLRNGGPARQTGWLSDQGIQLLRRDVKTLKRVVTLGGLAGMLHLSADQEIDQLESRRTRDGERPGRASWIPSELLSDPEITSCVPGKARSPTDKTVIGSVGKNDG